MKTVSSKSILTKGSVLKITATHSFQGNDPYLLPCLVSFIFVYNFLFEIIDPTSHTIEIPILKRYSLCSYVVGNSQENRSNNICLAEGIQDNCSEMIFAEMIKTYQSENLFYIPVSLY